MLELSLLIGIITCFLKDFLVIILNFSLFFFLLLLVTLYILMIVPKDKLGNAFLILKIFSILPLVA